MGSNVSHRIIPVAALALALAPAAAGAASLKDYSKNGATGDFAPAISHKNYSLNGATGDYTPATTTKPAAPTVRVVRVTEDSGFAWSDAAAGAATVLLVTLLAGVGLRRIRRRRIVAPSPARPTAI